MNDLVTAVMITGLPDRKKLAVAAITAFRNQTHPRAELLVIDDGEKPLVMEGHKSIKHIRTTPGKTLGELRNVALAHAQGDWIVQWDDDDWYHHDRIRYQLRMAVPGRLCTLRYQVRYAFEDQAMVLWQWTYPEKTGIPGTMLFPNESGMHFRAEPRHEDSHFIEDYFLSRLHVVENVDFAHCYIRFYHGSNTWDRSHVMGEAGARPQPTATASAYVQQIVESHYKHARLQHRSTASMDTAAKKS